MNEDSAAGVSEERQHATIFSQNSGHSHTNHLCVGPGKQKRAAGVETGTAAAASVPSTGGAGVLSIESSVQPSLKSVLPVTKLNTPAHVTAATVSDTACLPAETDPSKAGCHGNEQLELSDNSLQAPTLPTTTSAAVSAGLSYCHHPISSYSHVGNNFRALPEDPANQTQGTAWSRSHRGPDLTIEMKSELDNLPWPPRRQKG